MTVKPISDAEREAIVNEDAELPERFALPGARALPNTLAIRDAYEARLLKLEAALQKIRGWREINETAEKYIDRLVVWHRDYHSPAIAKAKAEDPQ